MELNEYVGLCERTEARNFSAFRLRLEDPHLRTLHSVLGLASELEEIITMPPGEVEEYGDLFWYIAIGYASIYITDPNGQFENDFKSCEKMWSAGRRTNFEELVAAIGKIQDAYKKWLFYSTPPIMSILYFDIMLIVYCLIREQEQDPKDILEKNINKLKVRYPQKFTERHAVIRNLENEKDALEK